MAVAFVKNHPVASAKAAGTTLAVTLDTPVPAGNLIVLRVVYDNAATASKPVVSSVTVAAGETAVWSAGTSATSTSTSAGSFASGHMRYIRTTVQWPAGSYTVTLDTSTVQKAAFFQEFTRATDTNQGAPGTTYSTTTTAASASTLGGSPAAGDLTIGFIFGSNAAANQAGDNDTTGGAWSAVVGVGTTGGNVATNNWGVAQYKVLTSGVQQTLNNSAAMTAGNGVIVTTLRATNEPPVTQASYRWYAEGTETAAAPLANQDTAAVGDIANGDATGTLRVRMQNTSATFGVDPFVIWQLQYERNASGTWVNVTAVSPIVTAYASPNLPAGAATTNRLGAGTGAFVAGVISENGVVTDGWSFNNYTEHVYALKVSAAAVVAGDTIRFRVLYNGATTGMTYTVTPTLNIIHTPVAITQAAYRWYDDILEMGVVAVSYPETNQTTYLPLVSGQPAYAQSFLGTGQPLSAAGFWLAKTGTPTGTVTAKLYAHTGSFGSSGLPTGAALATSTTTINATSLLTTPSYAWTYFQFDDTYTLVNGTPYFIALESSGAAAGVGAVWGLDETPTYAGRLAMFMGAAWSVQDYDACFKIITPGGALAAQDTPATGDVTTADGIGQLRVRLQSTTAAPLPATDDWQLQWEKNANGTWTNVSSGPLDGYDSTNYSATLSLGEFTTREVGQSFLGNGGKLTLASFWMAKTLSPLNIQAKLYAHTGTFGDGSTGKPTGSALATSTTRTAASFGGTLQWEDFVFDGTVTLTAGTPYVIVVSTAQSASGNSYQIGYDNTSPTHAGNYVSLASGVWTAVATSDIVFRVYTSSSVVPYASPNLTDAAATTNRLTGGTGTFTPGKISETGLVSDVGWAGNNFTELLYSLDVVNTDVVNGDTLRFRVLRNGVVTSMTYTQTPTLNVVKAAPVGGKIKWYDGSAQVAKPVKWWNGSAWVEKPLKHWTGSQWKLTNS